VANPAKVILDTRSFIAKQSGFAIKGLATLTDTPQHPRPDYQDLATALDAADAELTAAESHGVLCGMSCARGKVPLSEWLEQVFEPLDLDNSFIREACQLLTGLYENTRTQLYDPDIGFEPLLPDDNTPLEYRTEALAQWCQGFTYGLAAGGLSRDRELPADTRELIEDMVQIARAGHQADGEEEHDEDAYIQVYEYVRMGVLLINEELQPMEPPEATRH